MVVVLPVFVVVLILLVVLLIVLARTNSPAPIRRPAAEENRLNTTWRDAKLEADRALQRWRNDPNPENASALQRANDGLRAAAEARASESEQLAADPIEQLGRLADLRDRGVVTEEEFTAKKRDLLERPS
jgi:hypothetical protein